MRTPKSKIRNRFIVYGGNIYSSKELVRLANGSYIPKKFAVYNPGNDVFLEKSRGYSYNGIMIKKGKITPVYINTALNVFHAKLGYSMRDYEKIKQIFIKIKEEKEKNGKIINPLTELERKCVDFVNDFNSFDEFDEFLVSVIYRKGLFIDLPEAKYEDFFIYIEEDEEVPKYFSKLNNMLYLRKSFSLLKYEPVVTYFGRSFNRFPYNISEYSNYEKDVITNSFAKVKVPSTNEFIMKSALLIGSKYTLGVEVETSSGVFSNDDLARIKSLPLTDGSLRRPDRFDEDSTFTPLEAATLVIKGAAEIIKLMEGYRKVLPKIEYDNKASIHVHFGGYPLENDFIIAFYNLCRIIQNELFHHFPYYKTDYREAGLSKNYCQKLDNLHIINSKLYKSRTKGEFDEQMKPMINTLFKAYSEGYDLSEKYNIGNTIKGIIRHPNGDRKWNHSARYKWNNLMNYFFSPSRTLELRISPMTHVPEKIMAMCLLQYSLIEYASKNRVDLISKRRYRVSLNEVFDVIPDTYVRKVMKNYFNIRKTMSFSNDVLGEKEKLIECPIGEEVMTLKEK